MRRDRVLAALTGWRFDLELGNRWWHRLLVVGLWLTSASVAAVAWLLSYAPPERIAGNVNVFADLKTFSMKNPEMPNTVPAFLALGDVAVREPDGRLRPFWLDPDRVMCAADLRQHPEAVAAHFRANEPGTAEMEIGQAVEWLERQGGTDREGRCLARASDLPATVKTADVVAYSFTSGAVARSVAVAAAVSVGAVSFWCLVALNFYFRAILFVAFGRPSK